MISDILAILPKLKEGDRIRINGKSFTIKEKITYKAPDERSSDIIRYELGENFVLEYEWDWKFFECVTKKGWFGTTTTTAKYFDIENINTGERGKSDAC